MSDIDDVESRLPPLEDLARDLANIEREIYGETYKAMQSAREQFSAKMFDNALYGPRPENAFPIHDALPDDTAGQHTPAVTENGRVRSDEFEGLNH